VRSDGFAGVEQFVLRLAIAQALAGHRVHVIGGDPAQMRPPLAAAGVAFTPASRTAHVARAIRRSQPGVDVVNTHMSAADLGAPAGLFGIRGRPVVVATRHFAQPRGRIGPIPIDALVKRTVDAEIAISSAVAAWIGVPSTVVHSGVEPRPLPDPGLRTKTVLIAQRLEPEKATDDGVRAFAASGLAGEGWVLEIAGRGSEQGSLLRLATDLAIADVTRFLGFRADLPELMGRAGMLLAPCRREGLGLTVIEAMAAALPVIAADAGGHTDLLEGLDARALFTPGDVDAAAAALRALAEDPAARQHLGSAERDRQIARFTPARQLEGTIAVYREAIAGHRISQRRRRS
jgi:glycosyltransferase involved in cell wall biosynthesis